MIEAHLLDRCWPTLTPRQAQSHRSGGLAWCQPALPIPSWCEVGPLRSSSQCGGARRHPRTGAAPRVCQQRIGGSPGWEGTRWPAHHQKSGRRVERPQIACPM